MEISKAINRLAPTANFAVTNEDVNQVEWRSDDVERPSNEAILAEAEVVEAEEAAEASQKIIDKASANQKLLDLGLTQAEVDAFKK